MTTRISARIAAYSKLKHASPALGFQKQVKRFVSSDSASIFGDSHAKRAKTVRANASAAEKETENATRRTTAVVSNDTEVVAKKVTKTAKKTSSAKAAIDAMRPPKLRNVQRCPWANHIPNDGLYLDYHDEEWGNPDALGNDDNKVFELLNLECAQAGLSWRIILGKREGYRKAFHDFEITRVAQMTKDDVDALVLNPDIVRHRGKIEAFIQNAKCVASEFSVPGSFKEYLWSFRPPKQIYITNDTPVDVVVGPCDEAKAMSAALKKKGFKFCGPMACHSFMQAAGIINHHHERCFLYPLHQSRPGSKLVGREPAAAR